jgi:hypothetical protein
MVFSAAEKLVIAKMAMAPRVILRLLLWKLITLSPSMVSHLNELSEPHNRAQKSPNRSEFHEYLQFNR